MAKSTELADLLNQAGDVFSLAGKLGRAFHAEHQYQPALLGDTGWNQHLPDFDQYCEGLNALRDSMKNPPDGFASVAHWLIVAARIAKSIRDAMRPNGGLAFPHYLDFFPDLNTVFRDGWEAIDSIKKAKRLDDPLAYVDDLSSPLEAPAASDGRIDERAIEAHGQHIDNIYLGAGNRFPISDFDAKIVDGDTPSICPNTDRPISAEWLPTILGAFRRLGYIKPGQTIHWVGGQSRLEHVCTCFRADTTSRPGRPELSEVTSQSEPAGGLNDKQGSAASEPADFGQLLAAVVSCESAYQHNIQIAEKYQAKGSPEALHWRIQAGLLRFSCNEAKWPGIQRLEAVCQASFGSGITAENLRRIRGALIIQSEVSPEAVDSMTSKAAADAFVAMNSWAPSESVLGTSQERRAPSDRKPTQTSEAPGVKTASIRMSQKQVQQKAVELAHADPDFKKLSIHKMAEKVGCSPDTLRKTDFWSDILTEQPERKRTPGQMPKAVELSAKVLSTVADATTGNVLDALIADEEREATGRILASGMSDEAKQAVLEKLRDGELTPEATCQIANEYPPKLKPVKPFRSR